MLILVGYLVGAAVAYGFVSLTYGVSQELRLWYSLAWPLYIPKLVIELFKYLKRSPK